METVWRAKQKIHLSGPGKKALTGPVGLEGALSLPRTVFSVWLSLPRH